MRTFRIRENGFREIRNQILFWSIPLLLIAAAFGVFISEYSFSNKAMSGTHDLPLVIVVIIGVMAFGSYKGIKRQKIIYDTYLLKIDHNCIIREQGNTPAINISLSDIKSITKTNRGGLVIKGNSSSDLILVPAQINDMEGLVELLTSKSDININTAKSFLKRLMIPLLIFLLSSMGTLYISTNKILVSMSGILLLAFLIWSFISIQKNKNIDNKTRKSSYWMIMLVITIIMIMIGKLMK
jgi:hypothetical protein